MPLRVLDVYAGRGGLSRAFRDRGHDVVTLDNDPKFGCDLTMDAIEFAKDPWRYLRTVRPDWDAVDVILGGPPCEALSVLTIGRNWTRQHQPKTDKARLAVVLVQAFLDTVKALQPKWWWMENPRAKLRKLPVAKGFRRITITYCSYGAKWQKPTDLWGVWPPSWRPRPKCRPKSPCHESAPAGSRRGIQGDEPADVRAEAPVSLSRSRKRAKTPGRRPPPSMRGRRHEVAIQDLSGGAPDRRAEAPPDLALSFAVACEDPTPNPNTLEAFT